MARAEVLAVAPSLVAAWAEVASAEALAEDLAEASVEASEAVAVAAVAQAEDFNSENPLTNNQIMTLDV